MTGLLKPKSSEKSKQYAIFVGMVRVVYLGHRMFASCNSFKFSPKSVFLGDILSSQIEG